MTRYNCEDRPFYLVSLIMLLAEEENVEKICRTAKKIQAKNEENGHITYIEDIDVYRMYIEEGE